MTTHHFTDENFESEVLKSSEPVLVDFWAEWCGPCKAMSPIVDELAAEFAGKVKIGKLNIEESLSVPSRFGIRGIPTFIIFRDGKAVVTRAGGMSKAQLADIIKSATE